MAFITVAASAIFCLLLLFYCGLGFSALSTKSTDKARIALLAPMFGFSYLGVLSWWSYLAGLRLTLETSIIILAIPTIINVYSLRIRSLADTFHILKEAAAIIFLMLIPLSVFGLPFAFKPDTWVITLGNNDLAHHVAVSRFLIENGRDNLAGFTAQYPHAFVYFSEKTYFGYYSLLANCSVLSGLWPHQVASGVLLSSASLIILPLFLILRDIFGMPFRWSILWSLLATTSGLTVYLIYNGFGAQLLGSFSGFCLIYTMWPSCGNQEITSKRSRFFGAITAIIAILLVYQHMLVFVFFVLATIALARSLQQRDAKSLMNCGAQILLASSITVLILPSRWLALIDWLRTAASSESGWPLSFLWPDHLFGLTGPVYSQMHMGNATLLTRIGVIAIIAVISIFGICIHRFVKNPNQIPSFASALIALYMGAMLIAHREAATPYGGYKSFKLLSFFAPGYVILFGVFCYSIFNLGSIGKRIATITILAYGFYMTISMQSLFSAALTGNMLNREADTALIVSKTHGSPINIVTKDFWVSMWMTYYFLDHNVFLAFPTYYPATSLEGKASLVSSGSKLLNAKPNQSLFNFSGLHYLTDSNAVLPLLGDGWYGEEAQHVWMGANGNAAMIEVYTWSAFNRLHLTLAMASLVDGNTYELQWNGTSIAKNVNAGSKEFELVSVKEGKNVLRIISDTPPMTPGNGDPRMLSFSLQNCTFNLSP